MSQLQNIHNTKRTMYLFERDNGGKLHIRKDDTFRPYYYERDSNGKFETYDNLKARKVECADPGDIKLYKTGNSYEADITFPKRYLVDKIASIEVSPIKYIFMDIEILTKDFPDQPQTQQFQLSVFIFTLNFALWCEPAQPLGFLQKKMYSSYLLKSSFPRIFLSHFNFSFLVI